MAKTNQLHYQLSEKSSLRKASHTKQLSLNDKINFRRQKTFQRTTETEPDMSPRRDINEAKKHLKPHATQSHTTLIQNIWNSPSQDLRSQQIDEVTEPNYNQTPKETGPLDQININQDLVIPKFQTFDNRQNID